jgi:hypothetical protein
MMNPFYTSSFDGSHIPQPTLTMGGWNIPSYGSNTSLTFLGESAQMGGYYTYYTPSIYPSPAMLVTTNTFPMTYVHLSSSISYKENQVYGTGYPLHENPSSGENIYHHVSNMCDAFFSSQTFSSMMIPLQTYMYQLGGG